MTKITYYLLNQLGTHFIENFIAGKYPTMSGRLQLPTDFKVRPGEVTKSAVNAVSKSEAELKSLLRGSGSGTTKTALVKRKKKNKKSKKIN